MKKSSTQLYLYEHVLYTAYNMIFKTFYRELIFLLEALRFYWNPRILKADVLWQLAYLFNSPKNHTIKETRKKGWSFNITAYGETSLLTMHIMLKKIKPKPDDVFYELGCGTGRGLIFTHLYYHIPVVGYELLPGFIKKANTIAQKLMLSSEHFEIRQENWFDADLSGGTIFYVSCTCYDEELMEITRKKLREAPINSYIISASYPLETNYLQYVDGGVYLFSWSWDKVYIYRKIV